MTQQEFDEFRNQARARGFTHVITMGGYRPLGSWQPYGAFGGPNGDIGKHIHGFQWVTFDKALDGDPEYVGRLLRGAWSFVCIALPAPQS